MDEMLKRVLDCMGPVHGAGKELADYLGISPNVVTNWKNGSNRSYRRYLKQIAEHYGVSVAYLSGETDSKKESPVENDRASKDELIAFYGEVKDDLDESDIEDIRKFMEIKAQLRRADKK